MSIRVDCPTCGLRLQAPDSAAGKRVRCSGCKTVLTVPETVLEAEAFGEQETARPDEPSAHPEPVDDRGASPLEGDSERRPCPMCGEMIPVAAAKCRYCGEIFDPTLRRIDEKKKAGSADADLSVGDWLAAILCSGIACIFGIVWMIQGKPKGGKMVGVSLLFVILWGIVNTLPQTALEKR